MAATSGPTDVDPEGGIMSEKKVLITLSKCYWYYMFIFCSVNPFT